MRACEETKKNKDSGIEGGDDKTCLYLVHFARRWCGRRCARADNDKTAAGMCLAGGTWALLLLALVLCLRAGRVDGKNDNCEYTLRAFYISV